jgi:hypothetical protein
MMQRNDSWGIDEAQRKVPASLQEMSSFIGSQARNVEADVEGGGAIPHIAWGHWADVDIATQRKAFQFPMLQKS